MGRETKGGWLVGNACSIGTIEVFHHFLVPSRAIMHNRGEGGGSTAGPQPRLPVARRTAESLVGVKLRRRSRGRSRERVERRRVIVKEREAHTEPVLGLSDFRRLAPLEKPDLERCQGVTRAIVHDSILPSPHSLLDIDGQGMGVGSTGENTLIKKRRLKKLFVNSRKIVDQEDSRIFIYENLR